MKKLQEIWLLCFVGLVASPCLAEVVCPQLACLSGLMINLEAQNWPAGNYVLEIQADAKKIVCKGALPFNDCNSSHVQCSDNSVSIGESGCALPKSAHAISNIMMRTVPKMVSLRIMAPDGKIHESRSVIVAHCVPPTRKECGPPCCGASLQERVMWR